MSSAADRERQPAADESAEGGAVIKSYDNSIAYAAEISKNAGTMMLAILGAGFYCMLTIATTTDEALLSNSVSTNLPIINASVPIVWFYYAAPFLLVTFYFYFHLYLQRYWRCVATLPLVHPVDGRSLDEYVYPWLVSTALLRPRGRGGARRLVSWLESPICIALAWWFVPFIVFLFWWRFLMRHDWPGTAVHTVLLALSCGAAIEFLSVAMQNIRRVRMDTASAAPWLAGAGVLAVFAFVSFGAVHGAPRAVCQGTSAGIEEGCGPLYFGARLMERTFYPSFAHVEGRDLVVRPDSWGDKPEPSEAELRAVKVVDLRNADLRYAKARKAFLARADLNGAKLEGADLDNAQMQGAKLLSADLRKARLSGVYLMGGDLDSARLDGAMLPNADLRGANLAAMTAVDANMLAADLTGSTGRYADFFRAVLASTKFDRSVLIGARFSLAQLPSASFQGGTFDEAIFCKANLPDADLSEAQLTGSDFSHAVMPSANLNGAQLSGAVFDGARLFRAKFGNGVLTGASLAKANLSYACFAGADLRRASFAGANLQTADLRSVQAVGASFAGASLLSARLDGANLRGADLGGAANLTQYQLDRACGDAKTVLPHGLTIPNCALTGAAGDGATPRPACGAPAN